MHCMLLYPGMVGLRTVASSSSGA